jgi:hypothetical protein
MEPGHLVGALMAFSRQPLSRSDPGTCHGIGVAERLGRGWWRRRRTFGFKARRTSLPTRSRSNHSGSKCPPHHLLVSACSGCPRSAMISRKASYPGGPPTSSGGPGRRRGRKPGAGLDQEPAAFPVQRYGASHRRNRRDKENAGPTSGRNPAAGLPLRRRTGGRRRTPARRPAREPRRTGRRS